MTNALKAAATPAASATRNAERFLEAAAEIEPTLKAFTCIDAGRLRAEAVTLDRLPKDERGPLFGVPIAVKEVFDVAGYVCGWGTPIHAGRVPTADAAAVAALRKAGAMVAGITVSTEYAMSTTGPTTNPLDPMRSPGASSQGSAAAVGAGLVPAALGSQTIGSIVRPAAYCGVIGFKPTWGLVDDTGAMPLALPIDHPGFVAADPDTAARVLAALAPSLAPSPTPKRAVLLRPWYGEATSVRVLARVEAAADELRRIGVEVEIAEIPQDIAAAEADVLDTILAVGMALHIGADYDLYRDMMSPRIRDYVERGRACPPGEYDDAMTRCEDFAKRLDAMLAGAVALAPATLDIAPLLTEGTGSRAPQRLWTLVGLPAASVPFGTAKGMPIGVQVVGPRGADSAVMATVGALYGKG